MRPALYEAVICKQPRKLIRDNKDYAGAPHSPGSRHQSLQHYTATYATGQDDLVPESMITRNIASQCASRGARHQDQELQAPSLDTRAFAYGAFYHEPRESIGRAQLTLVVALWFSTFIRLMPIAHVLCILHVVIGFLMHALCMDVFRRRRELPIPYSSRDVHRQRRERAKVLLRKYSYFNASDLAHRQDVRSMPERDFFTSFSKFRR